MESCIDGSTMSMMHPVGGLPANSTTLPLSSITCFCIETKQLACFNSIRHSGSEKQKQKKRIRWHRSQKTMHWKQINGNCRQTLPFQWFLVLPLHLMYGWWNIAGWIQIMQRLKVPYVLNLKISSKRSVMHTRKWKKTWHHTEMIATTGTVIWLLLKFTCHCCLYRVLLQ